MKGKIRILGHIGLTLLLLSALMLALAPVAQASSVSSVWMELPAGAINTENQAANIEYIIHFTNGATALKRGVDTITVLFPDGVDTSMGTAGATYDFVLGGADGTSTNYLVSPTGTSTGYVTCTADATVAGYRVKVTTPVDIPASAAATLKILSTANIVTPTDAANNYMIKLATSQDTSFVLSSAFPIGTSLHAAPATETNFPSSMVAGANAYYKFSFTPDTIVPIGGTVTVAFPVGTTLTSPVATTNVTVGNNVTDPNVSAVSVDTAARTLTATTAEALAATTTAYIYILGGALIYNPTTIGAKDIYVWTSTDGQKVLGDDLYTIAAGTATKLAFKATTSTATYSDDATILYAYTDKLYIESEDQYGNLSDVGTTEPTVALSVTTGAGAFYTLRDGTAYTNRALIDGILGTSNAIYYRPTSAGTHTLTAATVGSPSLTSATWTVYVAPAVVLKDANGQTIGTYGPLSTSTDDYTYGGAWIQAAISAAFPGDTVELGGSSGAPAIYELSTALTLDKQITLTSATSALYTTLRPTATNLAAINVGISGTAANPVIIDKLTFDRLRGTTEAGILFGEAVHNAGYDYLTVRNSTFNYIIPNQAGSEEAVILVRPGTITSCTISNNTFSNCVGFNAISGGAGRTGVIQFYDVGGGGLSGVTVSGNTLTNCNDYGIAIGGLAPTHSATISNNTITNGYSAICLADYMTSVSITGNTITGAYNYGIKVEGSHNTSVTIKNNTITGCAGVLGYAILLERPTTTAANQVVQYNDITGTNGYAIQANADNAGIGCQYNWFGSATGPTYTALTGATISKSNPNGTGDKITDDVTYYPWLYVSKATVVTDNASYQASTVKLVSGWNTLSTPVKLIAAADAIDELIPAGLTIGYYYDATGWHQITAGYVLNACNAVYVEMSTEKYVLLKFDTKDFSAPSKALLAGWNLVGLASLDSAGKQADHAVASVKLTAANLPGYSQVISPSLNATQTNMFGVAGTSWTYSSGETATSAQTMYAGLGYWVYMQNAATLAGFELTPIAPDLD